MQDGEGDLDEICDSLRDDFISDQMSDCPNFLASSVTREIQAKPMVGGEVAAGGILGLPPLAPPPLLSLA